MRPSMSRTWALAAHRPSGCCLVVISPWLLGIRGLRARTFT